MKKMFYAAVNENVEPDPDTWVKNEKDGICIYENICDLGRHCSISRSKVYVVDAGRYRIKENDTIMTDQVRFLREADREEIRKQISQFYETESRSSKFRCFAAIYQVKMEELVKDTDWEVRRAVAMYGGKKEKEILKQDQNRYVREAAKC